MARRLIAGNWKMNTSKKEAEELVGRMKPGLESVGGLQTVLCPPFVSLAAISDMLRGSSLAVGAQNMYHESSGAFTGEIAPTMLADLCSFVILGHSERRYIFGETDDAVGKKVEAAIGVGLVPIMCVGERLEEREGGTAEAVVERHTAQGLSRIDTAGELVLAYEPVWAIGTGKAATADDAQSMMAHIRRILAAKYGQSAAADVSLLYGGSVTADNVADFVGQQDVDGALVGGASLDADGFVGLVRNAASA